MQKGAKAQRDIEREEAIGLGRLKGLKKLKGLIILNVIPSEARNLNTLQWEHRFLASLGMTDCL